jgi:hypothetical protein
MGERFSHRRRDSVIRPIGVLLAYECLFEATHGPVQIACGAPALTGRHPSKSRELHLSGLRSMVHPAESTGSNRKLKRAHACHRPHHAPPARSNAAVPGKGVLRDPAAIRPDGASPEEVVEARRLRPDGMQVVQYHSSVLLALAFWLGGCGPRERHRIKASKARLLLHETPRTSRRPPRARDSHPAKGFVTLS